MLKKEINNLELTVYSEKLDNGLEIYIVPKDNVNNTYATYTTRYGGIHNDFIPSNEEAMITVPKGIAHFLEHKMFEQENGEDVFSFFSERGSDANANTNPRKTTYLFSGPNAFYENLEFLLSYVENPYFTDENVEKEKGIIEQEIKMYQDKPYSRMYNGILYNLFHNYPMKYPTIGTIESINSITKEDLYKCYNTFYHPSNMFLVVTGNVDPEKVIELVKKHEAKRNLKENNKIVLKEYEEPREVANASEIISMDVTVPKTAIAYKFYIKDINMRKDKVYSAILNTLDLKLGTTSLFCEKLRNEGLITGSIDITGINADDFVIAVIDAETKEPEKVIKLIKDELKHIEIEDHELERRKRTGISDLVLVSDNIFRINNMLVNNIIVKGEIEYDPIGNIRKTTNKEVKEVLKNINFENYTVFTVMPDKA